jgi:uncharacterized protein (UPF0212 family)
MKKFSVSFAYAWIDVEAENEDEAISQAVEWADGHLNDYEVSHAVEK